MSESPVPFHLPQGLADAVLEAIATQSMRGKPAGPPDVGPLVNSVMRWSNKYGRNAEMLLGLVLMHLEATGQIVHDPSSAAGWKRA